jgi:2-polyprenyl-6-methoxyphenol hydroxylase-like FAD-dependent oxidoreductase
MKQDSTSVLVVGGSLVGLSAAVFLAWRGVPTVLVERHPGSSPHPRAIGYTARTLELFRAVGLGGRIPEAPANFRLLRARVESLAGNWFEHSSWTPPADAKPQTDKKPEPKVEYSPCVGAAVAQDKLEPILRERAIELGADIRLSTTLLRFEQDDDGVTAWLRARDGDEYTVRAAYLIAADGASSPIRESLGIARSGRGHMRTLRSVLFRAPLEAYLEKGITQFEIDQPDFKAFLTTYNDGRWVLMFSDDAEHDERALRDMIVKAIGRADVDIEILATGRWELDALVTDRFSSGRVFLAGDAAHALPPTRGGYGANTGIHDAHDLAWKLAAVLSGTSTSALLDTYDAERRPVAWRRHQQTLARPDYKAHANGFAEDEPIIDEEAMEFGQLYRSTAVLGAGEELPPALRPDQWAGQPGTRAPHLWVTSDGQRLSTLDLFQRSWVLLAEDERWRDAAARAGDALGMGIGFVRVGVDVAPPTPEAFRAAFGVTKTGASLIRPDGYVAWRSEELPSESSDALLAALAQTSSATSWRERL